MLRSVRGSQRSGNAVRYSEMIEGQFYLPIWYDLLATFAFGITGAVVGLRKQYDIVGVTSLALAVGIGGGVIRDGIFLQTTPAAVTDWRYMAMILLSVGVATVIKRQLERRASLLIVALLDALGLAAYTVVGTQKSIFAGLAIVGAVLVGVINAVGGGVLRDVLSGEAPQIFRPSQWYALLAVLGSVCFLALCGFLHIGAQLAAVIAVVAMIAARTVVIVFDLKTIPAEELVQPLVKRK